MLKGEVYWVKLSEAKNGRSSIQAGIRLCVTLESEYENRASSTLMIAPATTKIEKIRQSTHHIILKKDYEKLKSDTLILLEQTRVIDKEDLGELVFKLSDLDIFIIDTKLKNVLDIYNLKTNNVAREVNKLIKSIVKFDGIITMMHDKIDFGILLNIIEVRDKRLNSLKIFCDKNNINILTFYRESAQLREIIESYKNIRRIQNLL